MIATVELRLGQIINVDGGKFVVSNLEPGQPNQIDALPLIEISDGAKSISPLGGTFVFGDNNISPSEPLDILSLEQVEAGLRSGSRRISDKLADAMAQIAINTYRTNAQTQRARRFVM